MRYLPVMLLLAASASARAADDAPVSFHRDVRPLLNAQCNACHKPEKDKGGLDMTTHAALTKGGKHGSTVVPGDPGKSTLIESVTGPEPDMPKDADPLKPEQVDLLARWIKQGAKDDTPAPGTAKVEPPVYAAAPVITTMAFSPDGSLLAVGGYGEVLLHRPDGSGIVARLVGEAPRVESIAFSNDGRLIGVAAGAPGEFGQVQVWDVASRTNLKTFQPSTDSVYGLSFSPDGKTIAVGAADKVVRRINVADGKVVTEFKAHADWVLATLFTLDGKTIVSGGRDKALKLIDVESGRFVDDINNPLESVVCMARHPKEELVAYGGDLGTPRVYKISDNQARTAGRNDTNLVAAFERQPGAITAVAFSPDGAHLAVGGSTGEVRVYEAKPKSKDAKGVKPLLVLSGHGGPVHAIAYKPDGTTIATGGFDGSVRLWDAKGGNLVRQFVPVPLEGDRAAPTTRPASGPVSAVR